MNKLYFFMTELIIAEKPKAALRLAIAFGNAKKKNFFGIPYYEVRFDNQDIIIASAVGHLYGLSEAKKTRGWPTFDIEWKPTTKYGLKYINALKNIFKKLSPDRITIACDYDTEGELIGYNILRFIFNKNQDEACRMKFSTLTKKELLEAYKNKMPTIDFNQAIAGETRHILDWFYGINLSRALMENARRILSIGRVQGPALAILTKREQEIASFIPERFWKVFIEVSDENGNRAVLELNERIKNEKQLEQFDKIKGKQSKLEVKQQEKALMPLPPFNLTELQMEAYRLFGYDPAFTLSIAQELYLAGLISYPRTSSQKLPPAIGYKSIIQKIIRKFNIDENFIKRSRPLEGKMTDPAHPAIFPTGEFKELNKEEQAIYELIVKRFIACFCQDAIIETKNVKAVIDGKIFEKNFKKIKEKGWLSIYPLKISEEWNAIDGKIGKVEKVSYEEGQTKPPARYNPASIVKELEKKKLGTKTTRAQIIETLYKRGYIKGRAIQVTPLGLAVFTFLKNLSPLILDENLTREFELEMDKILISKNPLAEETKIIDKAKEVILKIAKDYEENKEKLELILKEGITKLEAQDLEEKKISKCSCSGFLILKRNKKGNYFIACTNWPECTVIYSLPKGKITVGNACNCGWKKLRLWKGRGKQSFEICANPSCEHFWLKKIKQKEK